MVTGFQFQWWSSIGDWVSVVAHFSGIWVLVLVMEFNQCLGLVGGVESVAGLGLVVGRFGGC